jgi:Fic family protein
LIYSEPIKGYIRLMSYNWQQSDWPDFQFDPAPLETTLLAFADYSGRVSGLLEGLPDGQETEAIIDLMIAEAITTSAIEGERLQRDDVMSSIRNHLGLNTPPESVKNRSADGAAELMVTVRDTFLEPLTEKTLFSWHAMLMQDTPNIQIGTWRTGGDPMQVVSGRIDHPVIHFEAPPAHQVPEEMKRFIAWFNNTSPDGPHSIPQAPVRSGMVHLYFESIHPFEDGNGRMGRALAEKALSQGLRRPVLLSLSRTIEKNRKSYYKTLETAQQSNEITAWIHYFVETVLQAQLEAEAQITFVLKQAKFFQRYAPQLNERQTKVVRRILQEGSEGFKGGMNARKYVSLTKVSKATATRDLQYLVSIDAFHPVGGGRSTSYVLNL